MLKKKIVVEQHIQLLHESSDGTHEFEITIHGSGKPVDREEL